MTSKPAPGRPYAKRRSLYVDRLKRIRNRRKSGLRGQPKTYSRHQFSSVPRHISKLPVASEIIDRRPKCARMQRATLSPGNKERWTQSRPLIAEERRTPAYFDASFATAFVMRHVHVKFVRLYARVLSPALPKRSPIRAADYGSGTGVFASELCRCCTRAEIQLTLIDQSEVMLHAAKKLNSRRHLFPIQFKLGDFTADSQKYDLIIMARGSCKTARSPDFSKISGDF